jgi:hypothetical protein
LNGDRDYAADAAEYVPFASSLAVNAKFGMGQCLEPFLADRLAAHLTTAVAVIVYPL